MKLHTKALRYVNERTRFTVHFAVYVVTLSVLCLVFYFGRAMLGIAWLMAIAVLWTTVVFVHLLLVLWKRRVFRRGHR